MKGSEPLSHGDIASARAYCKEAFPGSQLAMMNSYVEMKVSIRSADSCWQNCWVMSLSHGDIASARSYCTEAFPGSQLFIMNSYAEMKVKLIVQYVAGPNA